MNPITNLIEQLSEKKLWDKDITLKRNEYLCISGNVDTNIYLISSGSLRIFVVDEEEEHTIRFGYKNNLITALDSFLSDKPTDFYIQAIKKTTVKFINKKSFKSFILSTDENKKTWLSILEYFVLQQMERERDILTASPIERYKRVLKRSPQLFQEIPNKYIASYLRMTPETLSRIKKS